MTVSSQVSRAVFTGNGSTTVFGFNFRVLQQTDIRVSLVVSGVSTVQTLTTHYTVTLTDTDGTVTFVTAPASGAQVVIERLMDYTQPTDYSNQGSFYPSTHERSYDRATMLIQQSLDLIGRGPVVPSWIENFATELPTPAANRFLVVNSTADGFTLSDQSPVADPTLRTDLAADTGSSLVRYKHSSGSAISRTLQNRLEDRPDVRDWGADPTGSNSSQTAIANAVAEGLVYAPEGVFILDSATITFANNADGHGIIGAGADQTIFRATHSAGPVFRLQERFQRLEDMTIDADATRSAGSAGSNYGVLLQPNDAFGENVHDASLENIKIANQPSHGLVFAGGMFGINVDAYRIRDCKGHGVVIDNGTVTGMTNTSRPGAIYMQGGHVHDNAGHAFKIGDDDGSVNIPLRIQISNVDTYRNALTAGVRKTADAFWCYMEDSTLNLVGFGCGNISATPTVGAMYLAGRDNRILQPRLINPTQPPITLGSITVDGISSTGNIITGITVSGMAANADPVVQVHDDAVENVIESARVTEIDTVATPRDRSEWQLGEDHYHHQDHHFKSLTMGKARTIADDQISTIEFDTDPSYGVMVVHGNTNAKGHAVVFFRVGTSPEITLLSGTNASVGTGALTNGTSDGVDTDININVHTDKKVYIKNRTGGSAVYTIALLGGGSGSILPNEMEKIA